MLPKISVITPSYNQGKFLEETILSVLNQNYSNLEYIIIDGGSMDNSVEILKKYDDRISYWVSEPDGGQTQAINKGFRIATGDLVCWMNSDDIYFQNAFRLISASYSKNQDKYDVYFGDKVNIDKHGNVIKHFYYPPFCKWGIMHTSNMNISNQSAFWKRSLFEKHGYLDENIQFAMDYEFFMRLAVENVSFKKVNGEMGALRMYENNKSSEDKWITIKYRNLNEIKRKYNVKQSHLKKLVFYVYKSFFVGFRYLLIFIRGTLKNCK